MQVAELIGKTPDELKDMVTGLKKELFNLRFQRSAGEMGGVRRVAVVKKNIARIKTVMGGGAVAPKADKVAKPAKAAAKKTTKKAKKEE